MNTVFENEVFWMKWSSIWVLIRNCDLWKTLNPNLFHLCYKGILVKIKDTLAWKWVLSLMLALLREWKENENEINFLTVTVNVI